MSKFSVEFKLRVISDYDSGKYGGLLLVARRHNIGKSTLERWVGLYRAHGDGGLENRRGSYDAEFKLGVLRRLQEERLSSTGAAALFGIRGGGGVVSRWAWQYAKFGRSALEPKAKGHRMRKRAQVRSSKAAEELSKDELVEEVLQLRATVDYLKKLQAIVDEQKRLEHHLRNKGTK